MILIVTALLLFFYASPVAAHGGAGVWTSTATWTADPFILVPLSAVGALYLVGTNRLWRHAGTGRGTKQHQIACFWIGWTILALALLSPLHFLSERLLSAHMVEHELIMAVAAPLLVLSRPLGTMLWAFPSAWRRSLAWIIAQPLSVILPVLTIPVVATVLHSLIVWIWHLPALFDAAVANPWLHSLQHTSFLLSALVFWWAILRVPVRIMSVSAVHLFMTMIAMTALGSLITLSPRLLYTVYRGQPEAYGMTGFDDQQLAGLIMWVPGCSIYAAAAMCLLGLWISAPQPLWMTSRRKDLPGLLFSGGNSN